MTPSKGNGTVSYSESNMSKIFMLIQLFYLMKVKEMLNKKNVRKIVVRQDIIAPGENACRL